MSLANIIKIAKGDEEERVGISLKVPMSIKTKLEEFSKENNVSTNALINAMIVNGFGDTPVDKELFLELNSLEKSLNSFLLPEEKGGEIFMGYSCNPGAVDNYSELLESTIIRIKALRKILI